MFGAESASSLPLIVTIAAHYTNEKTTLGSELPDIVGPQNLTQGSCPFPTLSALLCPTAVVCPRSHNSEPSLPRQNPASNFTRAAAPLMLHLSWQGLLDPGDYNRAESSPFMRAHYMPDPALSSVARSLRT